MKNVGLGLCLLLLLVIPMEVFAWQEYDWLHDVQHERVQWKTIGVGITPPTSEGNVEIGADLTVYGTITGTGITAGTTGSFDYIKHKTSDTLNITLSASSMTVHIGTVFSGGLSSTGDIHVTAGALGIGVAPTGTTGDIDYSREIHATGAGGTRKLIDLSAVTSPGSGNYFAYFGASDYWRGDGAVSISGLLTALASIDITGSTTASTYVGCDRVAVGMADGGATGVGLFAVSVGASSSEVPTVWAGIIDDDDGTVDVSANLNANGQFQAYKWLGVNATGSGSNSYIRFAGTSGGVANNDRVRLQVCETDGTRGGTTANVGIALVGPACDACGVASVEMARWTTTAAHLPGTLTAVERITASNFAGGYHLASTGYYGANTGNPALFPKGWQTTDGYGGGIGCTAPTTNALALASMTAANAAAGTVEFQYDGIDVYIMEDGGRATLALGLISSNSTITGASIVAATHVQGGTLVQAPYFRSVAGNFRLKSRDGYGVIIFEDGTGSIARETITTDNSGDPGGNTDVDIIHTFEGGTNDGVSRWDSGQDRFEWDNPGYFAGLLIANNGFYTGSQQGIGVGVAKQSRAVLSFANVGAVFVQAAASTGEIQYNVDTTMFALMKPASGYASLTCAAVSAAGDIGISGGYKLKTPAIGDVNGTSAISITGSACTYAGSSIYEQSEVTMTAGDEITTTRTNHTVDTNGGAAQQDLDTITAGTNGQIVYLWAEDGARTVTLTENGNIVVDGAAGTFALDNANDFAKLMYRTGSNKWIVLVAADRGA